MIGSENRDRLASMAAKAGVSMTSANEAQPPSTMAWLKTYSAMLGKMEPLVGAIYKTGKAREREQLGECG